MGNFGHKRIKSFSDEDYGVEIADNNTEGYGGYSGKSKSRSKIDQHGEFTRNSATIDSNQSGRVGGSRPKSYKRSNRSFEDEDEFDASVDDADDR